MGLFANVIDVRIACLFVDNIGTTYTCIFKRCAHWVYRSQSVKKKKNGKYINVDVPHNTHTTQIYV